MAKHTGYDFCGWATRNDLRCSDGRTIRRDAFAHQDGAKVPLVWGHNHDSPDAVLGHGYLENRPEGVFFYGYFNDSDLAQAAKRDVEHGDITSLSIWANQLQQKAGDVLHGSIKEVSLVLAGANMGAQITSPIVAPGDGFETLEDEAYIYVGEEYGLELAHSDDHDDFWDDVDFDHLYDDDDDDDDDDLAHSDDASDSNEGLEEETEEESVMDEHATVQDVLDTMDEDQLMVVSYLVSQAAADDDDDEVEHSEGGNSMNFNAFEGTAPAAGAYLSHSDEMNIIEVAKKYGTLKEALQVYAEENNLQHDGLAPVSGFGSYPVNGDPAAVDALFPEWHDVRPGAPEIVTNDQEWVKVVLNKVHRSPFSRIRTSQVDLRTIEGIRAKGYQKGKEKTLAANYTVAKRTTEPQTIYAKSALNRDDVVDITDFD